MKRLVLTLAVILLTAAAAGAAATAASAPASPALERFKALAGDWVAAEDGQMVHRGDLVARYHVTAAGSAVVETLFPGSDHEMVTIYTADGPDLVLTHYCVAGNQPRMRAHDPTASRVEFSFDGGLGIDPARDRHMHSAWIDLVSPDELRTHWTGFESGAPGFEVDLHLLRQRD